MSRLSYLPRSNARRVFPHIMGILFFSAVFSTVIVTRTLGEIPADLSQAIQDLGKKITAMAGDQNKANEVIRAIDAILKPHRQRDPDGMKQLAEEISLWVGSLNENDKKTLRADAKFSNLIAAIDAFRDETDHAAVTRLIPLLAGKLEKGKFKTDETAQIPKQLAPLVTQIAARMDFAKLKVHIVSAMYGDHRDGSYRVCDATAYFRSKCEGLQKCPSDVTKDNEMAINGANLCGYEPAPQAEAGKNKAVVKYRCVNFELRPWSEIASDKTIPLELDFRGKGQITCQP